MDKNTTRNESININGISFSKQELEVISTLMRSPSYKEVSKKTNLSLRMVMYHINTLMKKTGVSSKEELVSFFRKENDIEDNIDNILNTPAFETEPNSVDLVYKVGTALAVCLFVIGGGGMHLKYFQKLRIPE